MECQATSRAVICGMALRPAATSALHCATACAEALLSSSMAGSGVISGVRVTSSTPSGRTRQTLRAACG
jgi:hypothetical protein